MKPMAYATKSDFEGEKSALASLSLPPPNCARWNVHRKAEVVKAVLSGVLSLEQACQRYALSLEEFLSWRLLVKCNETAGRGSRRLRIVAQHREHGASQA